MIELTPLPVVGAYRLQPRRGKDSRGSFVKTFHRDTFAELGLNTEWPEHYYSRSVARTVRGLHFQLPPFDHEKLVYCVDGRVLDVLLDLRVGSPSFGQSCTLELKDEEDGLVYVPRGVAHGFCALEAATLAYCVSSQHAPSHDAGVHFKSVDAPWPEEPVVSERDQALPHFSEFDNPFVFLPPAITPK